MLGSGLSSPSAMRLMSIVSVNHCEAIKDVHFHVCLSVCATDQTFSSRDGIISQLLNAGVMRVGWMARHDSRQRDVIT